MMFFRLMKKVATDKKKTAIIVEHKLEKIIDMVDRIIIMDKGSIAFNGTPKEVLSHYKELFKIGVVAPQIDQVINRINEEKGYNLPAPITLSEAVEELRSILPEKLPAEKMREVGRTFKEPRKFDKPIIEVKDLHFYYNPEVEILHGINLDIYEGEFLSIVGQNGSGKTTIVKTFNGLHKPTGGSVIVKGTDTKTSTVAKLSRSVGYCFQNPDHQIFSSVVRDELTYGPKNVGMSQDEIDNIVDEVSKMIGIEDILDENPYNLSKGQRQQIAVAAILTMKPDVIVVDEPTTGQDPRQSHQMMDMVKRLNTDYGKTIVVITHDMSIAAEYSDRIVTMHNGTIIAQGTPRDVFKEEEMLNSSNLESPQVTRLLKMAGITDPIAIDVDEAMQLISTMDLRKEA